MILGVQNCSFGVQTVRLGRELLVLERKTAFRTCARKSRTHGRNSLILERIVPLLWGVLFCNVALSLDRTRTEDPLSMMCVNEKLGLMGNCLSIDTNE
jgi:hypothetical protein